MPVALVSVKVKVLLLGVIVVRDIHLLEAEIFVEAWIVFARLAVLMIVNWNCPFASRIALVSTAGVSGAAATLTTPVMPAAAWPSTVHS